MAAQGLGRCHLSGELLGQDGVARRWSGHLILLMWVSALLPSVETVAYLGVYKQMIALRPVVRGTVSRMCGCTGQSFCFCFLGGSLGSVGSRNRWAAAHMACGEGCDEWVPGECVPWIRPPALIGWGETEKFTKGGENIMKGHNI